MLSKEFLRAMVEAMAIGSTKNGRAPDDWQEPKEAHEVEKWFFAIMRHWKKYRDTGKPHHLAKIAINAMFVWWHRNNGEGPKAKPYLKTDPTDPQIARMFLRDEQNR